MRRASQFATPILIHEADGRPQTHVLARVPFGRTAQSGCGYDERWLQCLIHEYPSLLPIEEIEPDFEHVVPVCLELPTPAGPIDNLFITPRGGLVLAECKLWRNPEARREVVAQAIDYARCLVDWKYEDLEAAAAKGQLPDGRRPPGRLWEQVAPSSELDETSFVDSVSRNLRLGRALLLLVGDGIREGTESLVEHLQVHAGLHFTLAMVELVVHRLPDDGGLLVQPRIPARTLNIERGIVRLDASTVSVGQVGPRATGSAARPRATTLSEESFYEAIAESDPALARRLQEFLSSLEPLGVFVDMKRSLILRWRAPEQDLEFNLGYIKTDAVVWTDAANWSPRKLGLEQLSHAYQEALADAVGGRIQESRNDRWVVMQDGKPPTLAELLAHEASWRQAIASYLGALATALRQLDSN